MPVYVVICPKCAVEDRRFLKGVEGLAGLTCRTPQCGGLVVRLPQNPTVHNKEVLDLPHMLKPVERYVDAEQLYEDRSKMDPRKPD